MNLSQPLSFVSMDATEQVLTPLTRKRYLELACIAKETCAFLEKKGVTRQEGCKLRMLTEELWGMEENSSNSK
jgi:hypothetical protein